jgi:hypothetical protein
VIILKAGKYVSDFDAIIQVIYKITVTGLMFCCFRDLMFFARSTMMIDDFHFRNHTDCSPAFRSVQVDLEIWVES